MLKKFVELYPPPNVFTSVNPSPYASLVAPAPADAAAAPTPAKLTALSPLEQLAAITNLRSTRTRLVAPRPLVRSFAPTDIPDGFVPPYFTFNELEILHHRVLFRGGKTCAKDLAFIKWVCSAYVGWLKRRRAVVTGIKEQNRKSRKEVD